MIELLSAAEFGVDVGNSSLVYLDKRADSELQAIVLQCPNCCEFRRLVSRQFLQFLAVASRSSHVFEFAFGGIRLFPVQYTNGRTSHEEPGVPNCASVSHCWSN